MDQNIHNNEQVLQQIEWNTIKSLLKEQVHFTFNFQSILNYLAETSEIQTKLIQTHNFYEFLYEQDFNSFIMDITSIHSDLNFDQTLNNIQKEKALDFSEINETIKTLEFYLTHFKICQNYLPEIEVAKDFHKFKREFQKNVQTEFRRFVSKDGEVDLAKHPILRPLYEKRLQLESNIRSRIEGLLTDSQMQKKIQFATIDIINDRYVIPLRSDSYQGSLGQIISRSESGNTLYIEPNSISQLNYERLQLVIQIQTILSKLELEYTQKLKYFLKEISETFNLLKFLDEYNSRAKFAKVLNLTYPEISSEPEIKLIRAFHPLIKNPIKNDIFISKENNGLIISGPNTGGKTATLKTLALCQLFLRHGLFIPCDEGQLPIYGKVFYFGNDGQDLNSGLSSFSAEVKNYTELFEHLGSTNLILIDEIFNSTSSEEASALAIALFKKLHLTTKVHLVVSSHHQTLKTILHQDEDYISAHVGFDTDNNSPTYTLHYGSPGSSHALRIFKSLTTNNPRFENVYDNALQFLDNKVIHYEKLLESISEKEHQLNKTLKENKNLNQQLKNQKASMEGVIKLKIEERVESTEKKLKKIIDKAEYILRETKRGNIQKTKQLDKHGSEMKHELKKFQRPEQIESPEKKYANLSTPKIIEAGKEYFCLTIQKTVLVKKVDKANAHIGTGAFSMKVPLKSLRVANQTNTKEVIQSAGVSKSRSSQIEYDCRGMRLEEFQSLVEDIISDLFLGDVPFVTIIHGHGTGVLKNWLRQFVKGQKDIQILKDNSGNDGETRLALN